MRFLVLNIFSRNSLAAVHALDKTYDLIGGACAQSSVRFLLKHLKTKRLSDVFWYSNPLRDSDAFLDDILKAVRRYKPDGIIASGTTETDYLSFHKKDIVEKTGTQVLVDGFDRLGRMTDKLEIFHICRKIGIPMPKTAQVKHISDLDRVIQEAHIPYPVVIKPRHSYASIGVKFFYTEKEIQEFLNSQQLEAFADMGEFVVQEKLSGSLHDATLCAYQGKVISILSQERLLSLYDFGGGGIINRTTYEPQLIEYTEKIIKNMHFSGIALFDYIKNGGNYYLLECNPKIWGTTQLTIEAGVNVVQQLVDTHIHGRQEIPKTEYEIGLVYKWIFPECVAHWFQRPRTFFRIITRIYNTFKTYEGTRTLTNLRFGSFLHLIGIIFANYGHTGNPK
jgi:predicted ATP-grasp superfamily ATP-dependent carboligase